jgi:hypothetical protein
MTKSRKFVRRGVAALLAAGALASWLVRANEPGVIELTPAEIGRILSHGPWPMAWTPDPTNRVSGDAQAIDLGERLFFDEKLSVKGNVSCGNCHIPEYNWTDGLKRGVGQDTVDRNTPTLMNLRHHRWFALDGAADSLWSQSMRPLWIRASSRPTPRMWRNTCARIRIWRAVTKKRSAKIRQSRTMRRSWWAWARPWRLFRRHW